ELRPWLYPRGAGLHRRRPPHSARRLRHPGPGSHATNAPARQPRHSGTGGHHAERALRSARRANLPWEVLPRPPPRPSPLFLPLLPPL
ncbi:unnamed protein product, partial [Urochloa humidicola]